MRVGSTLAIALSASIMSGCDDPEPNRSVVGSWLIPSDEVLAKETMTLWFRKYDDSYIHLTLAYVLRPGGQLQIKKGRVRSVGMFGGIEKAKGGSLREVQINHKDDVQLRRQLAKLRPAGLSKDFPFTIPSGCAFFSDDSSWSGVGFEKAEQGGAFVFQHGCEGEGAEEAKLLLEKIIIKLPLAEEAEHFIER